ncbi:MAG TPA: sugar phosphate isomerase/epimerase [candidate division Zixibacteria bacterium]|nr:sugar phosphate isomerase/epimerase [candidate division Zixibacteria bacterium]
MKIGIFTSTFVRPSFEEVLDVINGYGIKSVQLNMASVTGADMPDHLEDETSDHIRKVLDARGIEIAALSGTFNMIHPDTKERKKGMQRLGVMAAASLGLGASIITLCTGTRSTESMWRRHPANDSEAAWTDLVGSMEKAVRLAEAHEVMLAFEPEVNNVVDSALKARRLIDEIGSPYLKVCIDGANLFHTGELPRMQEILDQAFGLLGDDIVIAHAKDLNRDGDAGHEAAGTGLLDYNYYISLLHDIGFTGSLVLHSLEEKQVVDSLAFVRGKF